jgi:hypothetical protein
MPPVESPPRATPHDAFIAEAESLLTEIRDLFSSLIQDTCGSVSGAHEVADRLGIHRKLGWQIWRVAYGVEPFLSARYMPSKRGIETWLTAAARQDASEERLRHVREAAERFERLIADHAGDREMLEMLFDSCSSRVDEETDSRWRKQAFIGNSYVLGVHAKALISAAFLHPSEDREGFIDMARLHGLVDFVRTRPQVRWPLAQTTVQGGEQHGDGPKRTPLDDSISAGDSTVPLLPRFCSQPLPEVVRQPGEMGLVDDILEPGPVGQRGVATIMTGEMLRGLGSKYREKEGERALFGVGVRTPVEVLVVDQFVHHDVFGDIERRLKVFSELISPIARAEHDRLTVSERVQHLGRGLSRIHTAEAANYSEMVRYVFERTGWNAADFDVFRVRMPYAPLATSVMVENDLLPSPNEETP